MVNFIVQYPNGTSENYTHLASAKDAARRYVTGNIGARVHIYTKYMSVTTGRKSNDKLGIVYVRQPWPENWIEGSYAEERAINEQDFPEVERYHA
jgi:hypothetical protein